MSDKLLWLDLETGGLSGLFLKGKRSEEVYPILEIAGVLSDISGNLLSEFFHFHIKHESTDFLIKSCSDWSNSMFKKTLYKECTKSTAVDLHYAENIIIDNISSLVNKNDKMYLSGNSVSLDKDFVRSQMPLLYDRLHYRILDVSSIKIAWEHKLGIKYVKNTDRIHNALFDIKNSIAEYLFYMRYL